MLRLYWSAMKFIKYSKYVADPAGEMSMEDLLSALSDYLLQSGFQDSWYYYDFKEGEQTLDELRRAIQQALESGELLDENMREQLEQMRADGQFDDLIEKLIERMEQESYITVDQPFDGSRQSNLRHSEYTEGGRWHHGRLPACFSSLRAKGGC